LKKTVKRVKNGLKLGQKVRSESSRYALPLDQDHKLTDFYAKVRENRVK